MNSNISDVYPKVPVQAIAINTAQTGSEADSSRLQNLFFGLGFTWLRTKVIGQSNPYPEQRNTLTITLAISSNISSSAQPLISITCLLGKSWGSTLVTLQDPTGQNFDKMFADKSSSGTPGQANWDGAQYSLSFYLVQDWNSDRQVILSFTMMNKRSYEATAMCSSNALYIQFAPPQSDELIKHQGTISLTEFNYDLSSIPLVVGGKVGDADPRVIYQYGFTFLSISQSNPIPKENSTITFSFSSSLPLYSGSAIFLSFYPMASQYVWMDDSGVKPIQEGISSTSSTSHFSSSYLDFQAGTLCWNSGRDGVAVPHMALYLTSMINASAIYNISFNFTNPAQTQDTVLTNATIKSVTNSSLRQECTLANSWGICSSCLEIPSKQVDTPSSVRAVLRILAGYVETKIGQSSPLPSAINTLTVTLEVNNQLDAGAKVTLSGLQGAYPLKGFDINTNYPVRKLVLFPPSSAARLFLSLPPS